MSVLHTEEALLPVQHSPDLGTVALFPGKQGRGASVSPSCFSLALAGELNWLGVNRVPSCF